MAIIANDLIAKPSVFTYTPTDNTFSHMPVSGYIFEGWESCREVMQLRFKITDRGLWYAFSTEYLNEVVDFMTWIERTLRIGDSVFYKTENFVNCFFIEPDPFWKQCEMRKNIFTMFLRNARLYAKGRKDNQDYTIYDALMAYSYSKNTLPALERFLFGFTRYIGKPLVRPSADYQYIQMGWNSVFAKKDATYAKILLQLP